MGKEQIKNNAEEQRKAPKRKNAEARPDLTDPEVVLSLLEADQVVAAKQQTRFGRRPLGFGMRVLMWGLRIYVLVMMVIVVIAVMHALHS